jgi:hypothetical protein
MAYWTVMGRAKAQPVTSWPGVRWLLVGLVSISIYLAAATAANACADDVIGDWADNGSVDGTYPAECYWQAIAQLPEDLLSYSSAADDINRALQQALLAEAAGQSSEDQGVSPSASAGDSGAGSSSERQQGDSAAAAPSPAAEANESSEPAPPPEVNASAAAPELGDPAGGALPWPVVVVLVLFGAALASAVAVLVVRGLRERRAGRQ